MPFIDIVETGRFTTALRLEIIMTIDSDLFQSSRFSGALMGEHWSSYIIIGLNSGKAVSYILCDATRLEELPRCFVRDLLFAYQRR